MGIFFLSTVVCCYLLTISAFLFAILFGGCHVSVSVLEQKINVWCGCRCVCMLHAGLWETKAAAFSNCFENL